MQGKFGRRPIVLVTGCMGYIGCVLVEYLILSGYDVIGIDNLHYGQGNLLHTMPREHFKFVKEDARYPERFFRLIKNARFIIPLAAIVGAPACDRDPEYAQELNVVAINRLLALTYGQQRIIFPTTNSGYGTKTGTDFCTEETPLEPISHYGMTKAEAESIILKYPNAVSLRLATVFGFSRRMRFDLMVNDFVEKAYREGELNIFEPHFKRNFVAVMDVARAFVHCMRTNIANSHLVTTGVYNLGNDRLNMTKGELAQLIANEMKFRQRPVDVNHCIGFDPDKRDYIVSSEKIRKTGFECHFSISEAIDQIIMVLRVFPPQDTRAMRNV